MSTHNETRHLSFPWNEEIPSEEILIVRDIEVVGVGAKRRKQLLELSAARKIILQTHTDFIPESVRNIYDQELLSTLQWLRPFSVVEGSKLDFQVEQVAIFSKIFPLTEKTLGLASARVRDTYLSEMEWSSWLLQDHWRYFVGSLRKKFADNAVLRELAHWEWVQAWLEVQPFEAGRSVGVDYLTVNPSLQIVPLSKHNPILDKEQGLYAFVYNEGKGLVEEKSLDPAEAQLIDLLNEDRKYSTSEQLIEMALVVENEVSSLISATEWRRRFDALAAAGIVG